MNEAAPPGGWNAEGAGESGTVKVYLVTTDPELQLTYKSSLLQLLGTKFATAKAPAAQRAARRRATTLQGRAQAPSRQTSLLRKSATVG